MQFFRKYSDQFYLVIAFCYGYIRVIKGVTFGGGLQVAMDVMISIVTLMCVISTIRMIINRSKTKTKRG